MKQKFSLYLIGILLLIFLTACAPSSTTVQSDTIPAEYAGLSNPLGSEAAVAGKEVFQSHCALCHGKAGKGDGVAGQSLEPKPKNLADLQGNVADDYLFWRIQTGKPGTAMVAWKGILSAEETWQLVSFIRTLH